jgi:hypothetical protein
MDPQLAKLIKMLKLWLNKNSLDGDLHYYTIDEWRMRGEPYLNDSEFVIVTEGGLNYMLNYGDSTELYELVESFGYYVELGHSWNFGFYKDEFKEQQISSNRTYSEKLQDERWRKKREYILDRAQNQCQDCRSRLQLEIHHCYYMYGFEPWEYPLDSLRCLCRQCHEKRGVKEQVFRSHLAQLTTTELNTLTQIIDSGLLRYNRSKLFNLLASLSEYNGDPTLKFEELMRSPRR